MESPELRWHHASIAGLPPPPRTFRVYPCASLVQLLQRINRRFITTEAILEPMLLPIAKQIALAADGDTRPNSHTHGLGSSIDGTMALTPPSL